MQVFLTGVSCVGKTTVGRRLAELFRVHFFDLDHEIERFFGTSIERLWNKFVTMHSFREEASKPLASLLGHPDSRDCVIALPPSGLMGASLRTIKKSNAITVGLDDMPENITRSLQFSQVRGLPLYAHPRSQTPVVSHAFAIARLGLVPSNHFKLSVFHVTYALTTPGFEHTLLRVHADSSQTRWLFSPDGTLIGFPTSPIGSLLP